MKRCKIISNPCIQLLLWLLGRYSVVQKSREWQCITNRRDTSSGKIIDRLRITLNSAQAHVWPDQLWRASSSLAIYDHMTWLLPPKHFTTGLVRLVVQYASVSYWWPSSQRDRMAATILAVVYLQQMLMGYNILQNNVLMYSVILWINCSALMSTVAYICHMDLYAVMTTTTCISLTSAITLCEAGCYGNGGARWWHEADYYGNWYLYCEVFVWW